MKVKVGGERVERENQTLRGKVKCSREVKHERKKCRSFSGLY